MRFLCLFGILFFALLSPAQSTKLEWAKQNSGAGQGSATDMAVNDSGFVYTVGYFTGTVDFDPGADTLSLTSAGDKDIFIQKLSPEGDLVWAVRIGGAGADEVNAIALDAQGNAYLTGSFIGTVDFNPGAATNSFTSMGGKDIFVMKLSAAGTYIWAYKMGGAGTDVGYALAVDAAGATYIAGSFMSTVNFNPGGAAVNLTAASANFPDFFIQKVNAAAVHVWTKRIGGAGPDEAFGLALDSVGNIYTTGYFSNFADFDPNAGTDTLFAAPSRDVFILKLTTAGNYVWAKQLNGSLFASQGTDIVLDAARNVYLTGHFVARVDFDPGPDSVFLVPSGGSDPFVLKLDSMGSYVWARQYAGIASNQGAALAVDKEGSVYSTGYFSATVDFDPGPDHFQLTTTGLASDVYVTKLDSLGQLIWARNVGGTGIDGGRAIAVDTVGNVYVAGSFAGTVDFDPTAGVFELQADSSNSFIAKWNPCEPTYFNLDTSACYSYTSSTGTVYTATGVYREALPSGTGCDSFIIINLTINDTARQTFTETACGSFELNGETYDSTGIYTQLFASASGCDSILTLELTIRPTVTATATQNGDTLTATTMGATYQWLDCGNNYSEIGGATGATFIPAITGDYAVAVSANGCNDTSGCFNVTVTIIGVEGNFGQQFRLYPNPTTGKIVIVLGDSYPKLHLAVTTIAGQHVGSAEFRNEDMIELDLDLPAGTYYITLTTPQGSRQVLRVVRE